MQKLPLTSLFLATSLILAPLSLAQDEVSDNLKERIKSSVSNIQINQVEQTAHLKGYIGTVSDIIQNTIIIEDKEGKKSIKIDEDSVLVRNPGNKEIELESVRIDDSIIAIGEILEEDELLGKRLIVSTSSLTPPDKLSGVGTIKEIRKYSYLLSTPDSQDDLEIFFTNKTIYKSPTEVLDSEAISEGDEILYTAVRDKDDDWSATIVMQVTPSSPTPTPQD